MDDVLSDLSRAKVFTKIDARNGYWHVQIDDQSNKLTHFMGGTDGNDSI